MTYPQGCKDANEVLQKFGEERGDEILKDMIAEARSPWCPNRLVTFSEIPSSRRRQAVLQRMGKAQRALPACAAATHRRHGKAQRRQEPVDDCSGRQSRPPTTGLKGAILQFEDDPRTQPARSHPVRERLGTIRH